MQSLRDWLWSGINDEILQDWLPFSLQDVQTPEPLWGTTHKGHCRPSLRDEEGQILVALDIPVRFPRRRAHGCGQECPRSILRWYLCLKQLKCARACQGGFKNLQNRSRRWQSAHFSSIIGVLAPTAVGGYDFLKPPCAPAPNAHFFLARLEGSCRVNLFFETDGPFVHLDHIQTSGNPVRIGDGCATVTGYKLP